VIHRAILGSTERFLGILIEHFGGAFPVWLSPTQVMLAPVSSKHVEGAQALAREFREAGIRVSVDEADETVGKKVRNAAQQKIPYIIVVGDKELAGEDMMVRIRGKEEQEKISKASFIERVSGEIKNRAR
jgi:threonyl-tRNA synthetase